MFESYQRSGIPTRAIQYCAKLCIPKKGFYDKECMRTCSNNYLEVIGLYSSNFGWYHKKVDDMKARGEVPAILQDQIYEDKSY